MASSLERNPLLAALESMRRQVDAELLAENHVNAVLSPTAPHPQVSFDEVRSLMSHDDLAAYRDYSVLREKVVAMTKRFREAFEMDPTLLRSSFDRPPERPGHVRLRVTVPERTYEVTADEFRLLKDMPVQAANWVSALHVQHAHIPALLLQQAVSRVVADTAGDHVRLETSEPDWTSAPADSNAQENPDA